MTSTIQCPSCSRRLQLPERLHSHLVQCPTCGTTFTAENNAANEALTGPPVVEEAVADSSSPPAVAPSAPPSISSSESAEAQQLHRPTVVAMTNCEPCVGCGGTLQPGTRRCPSCGRQRDSGVNDDMEEDRPWEHGGVRRDCEPHRGGLVLALGICSISSMPLSICYGAGSLFGLPLGIAAWVLGQSDLEKMRRNLMDPTGRDLTSAGRICGIVGTVLHVMAVTCVGALVFGLFFSSLK